MKTYLKCVLIVFLSALASSEAWAQPSIVSVVPADTATGVSPTASVVFTFSEAMDISATSAQFFDFGGGFPSVSSAWTGGGTVLTCTPLAPWTAGHSYFWAVSGQNTVGDSMGDSGSFTIATSGGGGSGTNKTTTFTVGKIHSFDQTSTAAPVLDLLAPYGFSATTGLASNRTANSVSLTFPTAAVSNLTHNPLHAEDYFLFASNTNLTTFDATFPSGNYQFFVSAAASNQQVTVNLPASLTQPNAPHISNYSAAQSINSTQAFNLTWDAFAGGGAADFISVTIGGVYSSPGIGLAGALNGTSTSFLIPANTLQPNSNYDCTIGFYHAVQTSNSSYVTIAFVGSATSFTVATASAAPSSSLVLTNGVRTSTNFQFDIKCAVGQTLSVDYSSNLVSSPWVFWFTTNSPGNNVHVSDPRGATNRSLFYRARNGS